MTWVLISKPICYRWVFCVWCVTLLSILTVFSRVKPSCVFILETYTECRLKLGLRISSADWADACSCLACRAVCLIAPPGSAGYRKGRGCPRKRTQRVLGTRFPYCPRWWIICLLLGHFTEMKSALLSFSFSWILLQLFRAEWYFVFHLALLSCLNTPLRSCTPCSLTVPTLLGSQMCPLAGSALCFQPGALKRTQPACVSGPQCEVACYLILSLNRLLMHLIEGFRGSDQ